MGNVRDFFADKFSFLGETVRDAAYRIRFLEEEPYDEEEAEYVRAKNERRIRTLFTVLVILAIAVAVLLVRRSADRRTYSGYEVVKAIDKADNVSEYRYAGNNILRYSPDGAALSTREMETIWDLSFAMSDPEAEVRGTSIVIYDKLGTSVMVLGPEGKIGSFDTGKPINRAAVSAQGNVACVLTEGSRAWINYYTPAGSEIASVSTTMSDPGYPVYLSLAPDGMHLAVSYLNAETGRPGSRVVFYDFSENREEDEALAEDYPGTVIPEIRYLNDQYAAAFRDDGFTVYNVKNGISVHRSESFDEDVASVFYDENYFGFVFRSIERGHRYEVKLFDASGAAVTEADIDIAYDRARICGDEIILFNSTEFAVCSKKGFNRFTDTLNEGNIADILKIESNRYLVMTDQTTETIKLIR